MAGKTENMNFKVDDKPGLVISLPLAFQHLLSMFGATVIVPLIVGSALGLTPEQQTLFMQSVLFAMGIATIMQTMFGSKLPIVQGSSFAFLPAMISAPSLASVSGALIVGGFLEGIAGFSSLIGKLKRFFTPQVTGVTVILIGLSLAGVSVNSVFSQGFNGILIAGITLFSILLIATASKGFPKLIPILLGILVGYTVSLLFGIVDLSPVQNSEVIGIVSVFPWGIDFNSVVIISMLFAFLVSIVESVGDYHAISSIANVKLNERRINLGIGTEGLACMISGIFGGVGTTSYSENIGVVAITKVASRYVIALAGVLLIILSFFPKFSALLSTIPASVLGGATLVLYGMISLTGLRIIKENVKFTTKNMLVISVSLIMGVGIAFLPENALSSFPEILKAIFDSGMATGAITAIILDLILPESESDSEVIESKKPESKKSRNKKAKKKR